MDIVEFEWKLTTIEKIIKKHNLNPIEVEQVFEGKIKVRSSRGVYFALGKSLAGRSILVVFKKIGTGTVQIITARDMTKSEKRFYKKG